jgi:hypothetical protein
MATGKPIKHDGFIVIKRRTFLPLTTPSVIGNNSFQWKQEQNDDRPASADYCEGSRMSEFDKSEFKHIAVSLRTLNDQGIRAVLSNNLNIIIAALDFAADNAPSKPKGGMFFRSDCIFNYCPHPDHCAFECQSPVRGKP